MERSSGILMHISSLPSPYGIGTLGAEAYRFVDFLKAAGQKYWQVLPLGPTTKGSGDSPYTSLSTFAGNPYFVDLEMLMEDGILSKKDLKDVHWGEDPEKVDFDCMDENRLKVLRKAYSKGNTLFSEQIAAFRNSSSIWLENYALYMALKTKFDLRSWTEWPDDIRKREPDAVERYKSELKDDIDFWIFVQYLFYKQWDSLRDYAHENGISFIGDIPIYVAMDSADIWAETRFFLLDEDCVPKKVSGVPPDDFCDEGQLWGNPLYDYDAMKADGFGWWIRRIEGASRLYDVIRIDHFRAFASYWAVPYGEKTAKSGSWEKGPGMDLVGVLTSWFPNIRYIAEDLGMITDDVRQLLADSGLPGMKVLEFAFDAGSSSAYLPHNCNSHSCCYIGTHDNDTAFGWAESLSDEDRKFAADYMHITEDEGWAYGLIRTGMSTASELFVMQMQDVLELGTEARMNVPGVAFGNWRWRMKELPPPEKLRAVTETYRRI